jgi:protein-disulfide isomerase
MPFSLPGFAHLVTTPRRLAVAAALAVLLVAASALPAAADEHLAERPGDRVLGADHAPIVMIEYYSLDCPFCAAFHAEAFPRLKAEYIDTGKVRFVFRDYPQSWAALEAAILTHCAPPERFFAVHEALLKTLGQWSKAESTIRAVARVGETQGVSKATFKACIDARVLERQVFESQKFARDALGVKSTPTFFLNRERLVGNVPYDKLSLGLNILLDEIARRSGGITSLDSAVPVRFLMN